MKTNSKHYSLQKEYFDKDLSIYKDYKQNLNAWRKKYIERIKESLLGGEFKGKVLIDIGAGSGYISVEMAKLGMKVYSCDITPMSIKNLKKYKQTFRLENLKILKSWAEKIPLPNNSVDFIVANAVLEHIPNEMRAVKEWKRILKPKGKMFIASPIKYRYIWPFFWPLNYVHDKILGHVRRYDLEDLTRKFQLKVRKVYYTGHVIKTLWLVISRFLVFNIRRNFYLDEYFEKVDADKEGRPYGASNIIVIFEK